MSKKGSSKHKKKKVVRKGAVSEHGKHVSTAKSGSRKLEVVLKCDTSGCTEAVQSAILSLNLPEIKINIISSGVGSINKSDVFMAETGSRLIVGFNVGLMPHIEKLVEEHNVEIRIYEVIYRLIEDLKSICKSLVSRDVTESIIGSAKVIALFKSSRKGIIIGCEVVTGKLSLGRRFRILGAMGTIYVGNIESLHIERDTVKEARQGQQVGIKIKDFNKVKVGDLVESFKVDSGQGPTSWQPSGKTYYPQ